MLWPGGLAVQERLKMLALLTYADIGAVNPTALSPWKAENLWRVYFATANYLNRSVDDDRFHLAGHDEQVARIRLLAPQLGRRLRDFLEGLPQRYLRMHAAEEIIQHVEMASQLKVQRRADPAQAPARRFCAHGYYTRPSRSVCHSGRSAGWMGHEHPEGRRFFERLGRGGGHASSSPTAFTPLR